MKPEKNNWTLGETANLPRVEKPFKKGTTSYTHYVSSRYVCIREATSQQRGILLKVLGKAYSNQMKMVDGQPFGKDDYAEFFEGQCYFSYPFPSAEEVREVLDILRGKASLLEKLEAEKMHINTESRFWVRDVVRKAFLKKIPQVFSGHSEQLHPASDDEPYYRITMVYFDKGELSW
jgi:hypothetical protein